MQPKSCTRLTAVVLSETLKGIVNVAMSGAIYAYPVSVRFKQAFTCFAYPCIALRCVQVLCMRRCWTGYHLETVLLEGLHRD